MSSKINLISQIPDERKPANNNNAKTKKIKTRLSRLLIFVKLGLLQYIFAIKNTIDKTITGNTKKIKNIRITLPESSRPNVIPVLNAASL